MIFLDFSKNYKIHTFMVWMFQRKGRGKGNCYVFIFLSLLFSLPKEESASLDTSVLVCVLKSDVYALQFSKRFRDFDS